MKIVGVLLLLSVLGQQVIEARSPEFLPVTYEDVLLDYLLDVVTQHFSENSIGDDGFSTIDASLNYDLTDLFAERYGEDASTASFAAGFLDILLSPATTHRDAGEDQLGRVVGLVNLGEFHEARLQTNNLIFSRLPSAIVIDDLNNLNDEQVAALAVAVTDSFISIRNALSNELFEVYLNLKVGSTLSFALDTTGSMAGEITAAKDRIVRIIESTRGTVQQPLRYVLSPFNDPSTGPVTVTADPEVIIAALNALRASGGGDGPELALKGIEDAILASTRRSVVFMITDAQAKDTELTSRVIALAVIKKVRIISLLTNRVSGDAGLILYDKISSASGGLVTVTDKSNIGSITELFRTLTAQGQVKLGVSVGSSQLEVPFTLDSKVSDATIVLSGDMTFDRITNEDGVEITVGNVVTATGLLIRKLSGIFSPGDYTLHLASGSSYSMEIVAESTFGVIPTIFEFINSTYVHLPQLRAGNTARIDATLFGNARTSADILSNTSRDDAVVEKIELISPVGVVLVSADVSALSSANEFRTTRDVIVPLERFFIKATGKDRNGEKFTRVDPCAITPLVGNIFLESVNDQSVNVGETIIVTTTLTNQEARETFKIDVSDPLGFASLGSGSPTTVSTGSTTTISIRINIPSSTADGSVSVVTVTATPTSRDEFVFITFSVVVRDDSRVQCSSLISSAGSTISCTDFNNVASVCTVVCEADYASRERTQAICQADGTWTVSELGCDFVGNKQCQITGDPHYLTFDGKPFDFQGTCIYTAVATLFDVATEGREPFVVQVENQHIGRASHVSWFKRAYVSVYNTTFLFSKGRSLAVNGLTVNLPFSLAAQGLTVQLSGINIVLTTRFGLTITYNGRYNFFVRLSASYANLVEGMCGNLNGEPEDDLRLATNKSIPANPNDFGNSYNVGGLSRGCQDGSSDDGAGECLDVSEYQSVCSVVDGECFEECRRKLATETVLQNCVFDLCVTKGEKLALEQAVSDYATRCQASGITVCDWRETTGTKVDCPVNSHYEHEGTSCPNTCLNPTQSTRCRSPRVSGCVCDEGFVLSGDDCVPLSECGCSARGRYYKAGDAFYEVGCTSYCVCASGVLDCKAAGCGDAEICKLSAVLGRLECVPASISTCVASGDPHYTTLDGKRYDFQGSCTYMFAMVNQPSGNIVIKVENEYRNGNTKVTYVKSAFVDFSYDSVNVSITLGRFLGDQPGVMITGLTSDALVVDTFSTPGFEVRKSGNSVILTIGEVKISYENSRIRVTLPGALANKVSGLCGNFNGNPDDDFISSNGSLTSDANIFADSFRVGECETPGIPEPIVCTDGQIRSYSGMEYCGMIIADSGIFADCAVDMDLTPYYNNCLYDMCATGGDKDILTNALEEVVGRCHEEGSGGRDLCRWREATNSSTVTCPDNSHYEGCTSACPNSCLKPLAEDRCGESDVEGCACDFGFVWNNGVCVREAECGCFTDLYGYVPQGFSKTDSNCTNRCACVGVKRWECGEISCKEEETCTNVGTTYECLPPLKDCLVVGATYFSTFDGLQYNFNGGCSYVLVSYEGSEEVPQFSVIVDKSQLRSNGLPGNEVLVKISGPGYSDVETRIDVNARTVTVNGLRIPLGTISPTLTVLRQGTFLVVKSGFGLVVRSSMRSGGVVVTIPGKLGNSVAGMCGNSDGNPGNDMEVGGNTTRDAEDFGEQWEYGSCSGGEDDEDSCPYRRFIKRINSTNACSEIADTTSVHAACHDLLPPQTIVESCISAACKRPQFLDILEETLLTYHTACGLLGVVYTPDDGIDIMCPPNSSYSSAVPPCVSTCSDRDASKCLSQRDLSGFATMEGCMCDEGFLWSGDKCIPADKCGCVDPASGVYFEHAECLWGVNCSIKCQCRSGEWNCEESSCYSDQYCGIRDGNHGCHYDDGCYYDNGGCSHICVSSNRSVECGCPSGMFLLPDGKTCKLAIDAGLSCSAITDEWKRSYSEWVNHKNEYIKAFEEYRSDPLCSGGEGSHGGKCSVTWTRWFNTDGPAGCGDEETTERIRKLHHGELCDNPLAMELRLAEDTEHSFSSDAPHVIIEEKSAEGGLMCNNIDQPAGQQCPDYEVRFLCNV